MLSPPVELIRPTAVRRIPDVEDLLWQPKVDGWRAACFVAPDGVQIQARSGRLITAQFPELVPALRSLPPGSVVDGEIVCWRTQEGAEARLDFAALARTPAHRRELAVSVQFLGFDLLCDHGTDIRALPLAERWPRLLAALDGAPGQIQPIVSTQDRTEAEMWARALVERGFEGLVAKRRSAPYRQAPSVWWKQRYSDTVDGTVVDVIGASALRLRLDDGRAVTTRPLQREQIRQLAAVLADRPEDLGPLRVEVRIGAGRHGQVEFVRVRPDE